MTVDDKIIEKIQKLLNHADGTDIEAEQLAFIEKAQLLMQEHAIDQATLEAHGAIGVERITTITVPIPSRNPLSNGKRDLLFQCAENNRCKMHYHAKRHTGSVVGYEADAQYSVMLYTYLLSQMEWEMVMAQANLDMEESVRTFKANFAYAYAVKIGERLEAMNENIAPDEDTEEGRGMALVLVGRKDAVEQYVIETFNLKTGAARRLTHSEFGRIAGSAAADRADIAGARGTTGRIGE